MPVKNNIQDFLKLAQTIPVIDVRTPAEFEKGHIPGAFNLPIFSNEERVKVGTCYKQVGRQEAIVLGLELVGPKLKSFVVDVKKICAGNEVLVYCWRGGMRSESMAWLFELSGMKVHVLIGGYKSYRRHVREVFAQPINFVTLGGMTGSGKSELLEIFRNSGQQVLNLEAIAHHKGSVFGGLGQEAQLANEQFENLILRQLQKFDLTLPIWVENESQTIGHNFIPDELFKQLLDSSMISVNLPREIRIDRIINEYAYFSKEELLAAVAKITKRLGGLAAKTVSEAIDNGDFPKAVDILLSYYDKGYSKCLDKRRKEAMYDVELHEADMYENAKVILEYARTKKII